MAATVTGRTLRLGRLTRGGFWVMAALDHGVSMGPIEGLQDPAAAMQAALRGGATCLTMHKGLVPLASSVWPSSSDRAAGLILHLSASTSAAPDPDDKRLVGTVEEALRLGCDGVSLHINVGSATEARQIEEAGRVATGCGEWNVPLIAMMYPRGPKVAQSPSSEVVAHAARLGAELGADAVKVPYCKGFRDVVQGCPVPVLVAGGAKRGLDGLLKELKEARAAGAKGVSVGRNVFQQADPQAAMANVARVFA